MHPPGSSAQRDERNRLQLERAVAESEAAAEKDGLLGVFVATAEALAETGGIDELPEEETEGSDELPEEEPEGSDELPPEELKTRWTAINAEQAELRDEISKLEKKVEQEADVKTEPDAEQEADTTVSKTEPDAEQEADTTVSYKREWQSGEWQEAQHGDGWQSGGWQDASGWQDAPGRAGWRVWKHGGWQEWQPEWQEWQEWPERQEKKEPQEEEEEETGVQAPVEEKKEPVEEEEEEEVRVPLGTFPQQWANSYRHGGNAARYKGYGQDVGLGAKGKAPNHPMLEGNRRFGGPNQYWRPNSERYGARGGKNSGWVSVSKSLQQKDLFAKELFLEY